MKELTEEQIEFLDKYVYGKWKLNEKTGFIDIDGDFYCVREELYNFLDIKFGKVTGNFNCSYNKFFNLEGRPLIVKKNFDCSHNNIESLDSSHGLMEYVGGDFNCSINKLKNLIGGPEIVEGNYICSHNKLESLEGAPEKINKDFICSYNNLKNFKGAPKIIKGIFDISYNQIKNFEGFPKKLGREMKYKGNPVDYWGHDLKFRHLWKQFDNMMRNSMQNYYNIKSFENFIKDKYNY